MDYKIILSCAIKAGEAASKHIHNAIGDIGEVLYKGPTHLVTETDKLSEKTIIDHIKNKFPSHGILAEESGKDKIDSEFLWVIDPLDGTTNFVHDYPSYSISIACIHNNEPIVGVVFEFPSKHCYTAIKGQGARKDGKAIQVSKITELNQSLLVTGFGYEHGENWHTNMELFKKFTGVTQGVRRLGAASVDLCHLASGIVDGFWEFDLQPWDTAAGTLIATESGGKVSQINGDKYSLYNNNILATNGLIHHAMIQNINTTLVSMHS